MLDFLFTHTPLLYFTQSIWRDEAFSILAAQKPLSFILPKLTFEPPLYYILIHYWIKFFGTSEIAVRSLSLIGFSLAVVVMIFWAEKLFPKRSFLTWFLPLFFFFNPMLLYYAFEVRAYSWYLFFTTLSFYAYHQKHWRLLSVATILGFYTHVYMVFVPLVQATHWLVEYRKKHHASPIIQRMWTDPFPRSLLVTGFFISPWLLKILMETGKLKQSWYYPVDISLLFSVLGNMFVGYDGTPGGWWMYTTLLSISMIILWKRLIKKNDLWERSSLFFFLVSIPLVTVIGISFIKPLFVNRYLLPVTVGEIVLLTLVLETLKNHKAQKILAALFLFFVLLVNVFFPSAHKKTDIRATLKEVNALVTPRDSILANSSLVFFETIYYSIDPQRVFLYNPTGAPFPWYVGDSIVSADQMVTQLPVYPQRAFLIEPNGTYTIAFQTPIMVSSPSAVKKTP